VTEQELIERFFDSREEFLRHRRKHLTEFVEWTEAGEPVFIPESDELMSHDVEKMLDKYQGDWEKFLRNEVLPDLAHYIGYVKTTAAGAFTTGVWNDEPENFDALELSLKQYRTMQDGIREILAKHDDDRP
jgi:hypothetical protein